LITIDESIVNKKATIEEPHKYYTYYTLFYYLYILIWGCITIDGTIDVSMVSMVSMVKNNFFFPSENEVISLKNYYNTNKDFQRYVDRECQKNNCDVDTCLQYSWVRAAYEYYRDREDGKDRLHATEWYAGCGCIEDDKSC
jgi:hypothetical protein